MTAPLPQTPEPGQRFVSPVAPPEGLERELLIILMEECAEVQQRASKALRFGITEVQPGQPDDNARRLGLEIGDLHATIEELESLKVLRWKDVREGMVNKRRQLARVLQSRSPAPTEPAP